MTKEEIIFKGINGFDVEELFQYWQKGIITLDEISSQGYMQPRKGLLETKIKAYKEEERRKNEIQIEEDEKRKLRESILEEMRNNPTRFNYEYIETLEKTGIITYDLLVKEELITQKALNAIKNRIEVNLPQPNWKDLPDLPPDRTDIYFFGVPRSGKSCALAGLLYEANRTGVLRYQVSLNKERQDLCNRYYQGLLDCIDECVAPDRTKKETANYMPFNLIHEEGKEQYSPVSLIEIGGEYFEQTTVVYDGGVDLEMWKQMGATQYLRNDNKKMLFFVIDYNLVQQTERGEKVEFNQRRMLENVLNVFTTDGNGKSGEENCTMSKVDTVIVIVTKSDLMEVDDKEERNEVALEYLNKRHKNFMNNLRELCKNYGINKSFDFAPIVTTFSLGRFMIGNTLEYNVTDSTDLLEIIKYYTRSEKKVGFIPRLFAWAGINH